jgi:hypothetical protein
MNKRPGKGPENGIGLLEAALYLVPVDAHAVGRDDDQVVTDGCNIAVGVAGDVLQLVGDALQLGGVVRHVAVVDQ